MLPKTMWLGLGITDFCLNHCLIFDSIFVCRLLFKASALWADAFIELGCQSVYVSLSIPGSNQLIFGWIQK